MEDNPTYKSLVYTSQREEINLGEKSINWIRNKHPQIFETIFDRKKGLGYIFCRRIDGKNFAFVEVGFTAGIAVLADTEKETSFSKLLKPFKKLKTTLQNILTRKQPTHKQR